MTLLQIGINAIFAVIAYALVNWILNNLGLGGVLAFLICLIVAIGVFMANFAARIVAR